MDGRILFCIFSLSLPATAWPVDVYRCVTSDGGVSFQQQHCPEKGERLVLAGAQAAWSSLRKQEKRLYGSYRKRDRERAERRRRAERKALAARASSRAAATRCYRRRVALENAQAKSRAGYKPAEGERLRRRRDQLEEYLRRFCRR